MSSNTLATLSSKVKDMIKKCESNLADELSNFKTICNNIEDTPIENASIVVETKLRH
jgi:hypothetical protein